MSTIPTPIIGLIIADFVLVFLVVRTRVHALIAMLADTAYIHFMSNGREIMGPVGVAFGLILIAVLIAQTAYCAWMSRRGVIV